MNISRLIKLILFCTALLIIRCIHCGKPCFMFLPWNLFLAWLPYGIISQHSKTKNYYFRLAVFALSLLFLPNAPYIITDLFHLKESPASPLWLDLLLILSFALTGLFFFMLTVKKMHAIIRSGVQIPLTAVFKALLMLLSGYGIYLGRYLRFNSWDVITDPFNLCWQMLRSLLAQGHTRETAAITFTFSVFLYLLYELYESLQPDAAANILKEKDPRI